MSDKTTIPVSTQIAQLEQQLTQAFIRRESLETELEAIGKQIRDIRNVLAGINMGRSVERELNEKNNAKEETVKEEVTAE